MRGRQEMLTNERGGTIAFVAVSMVALLSMMALAIDLAMLHKARNEAQRAAEAASLAGASAFQDVTGSAQIDSAEARALRLASANFINGIAVDVSGATRATANKITTVTTAEATVVIIPDTAKVRTYVRRQGIGTWFARIFGKNSMGVQAKAAAWASPATEVSKCVKPFAVPDFYYNPSDKDQIWDPNETWVFDPAKGSVYNPYDPNASANNFPWGGAGVSSTQQTGLGSNFRNGWGAAGDRALADYGRQFMIKAQDPSKSITAPFFYLWRYPGDAGGDDIRKNICGPACGGTCSSAQVNTPYRIEPGNKLGPTKQGVEDLIALDPNARWVPPQYDGSGNLVPGTGLVTGSNAPNWVDSPRVIVVGFFDPNQVRGGQGPGNLNISFNNFAYLFLEGFQGNGNQAPLVARFLYYAQGTAGGTGGGPLARVLQLVE
ncbi:MAG TPA: pilus assembly protein TadG-related protein [Gemmatimonadales bacterium]|nr:pilus assembly protein TadG-related protein [Gemmatimonadales bacterium]